MEEKKTDLVKVQTNEQLDLPENLQKKMVLTTNFLQNYLKVGNYKLKSNDIVKIREHSLTVSKTEPILLQLALNKALIESFDYFNTNYKDSLLNTLISDIKEVYHRNSPIEILEAIKKGRQNQDINAIYGKLSGAHIMEWIRQYNVEITDNIIKENQYKEQKQKEELESALHDNKGNFIFKDKLSITPIEKREFSKKEKAKEFEYQLNYSQQQRDRIEHSRKWSLEDHGNYEAYMVEYDLNK